MPRFPTAPTVFPPIVPPAGPTKDMPMFALAEGGSVVAWTPPEDFRAAVEHRSFAFRVGDAVVAMTLQYFWGRDATDRRARADAEIAHQVELCRTALTRLGLHEREVLRDELGVVETPDGPATVFFYEGAGRLMRRGVLLDRGVSAFGFAFIVRDILDDLTVLIVLEANDPQNRILSLHPSVFLGWWGRTLRERGPVPAPNDFAAWYHEVGFALPRRPDPARAGGAAGWYPPGPFKRGEQAEARFAWVRPRSAFSEEVVDSALEHDLKVARSANFYATSVDVVSRAIVAPAAELEVLAGYEILASPQSAERDRELAEAQEGEEETEEVLTERIAAYNPGQTIRVVYLGSGDGYIRLYLAVGGRVSEYIDDWWTQTCERLWVWNEGGS
jgi:hypothetical protein